MNVQSKELLHDWALGPALAAEGARATRRVRLGSILAVGTGWTVGAIVAVAVDSVGARAVAVAALLAIPLVATLAARRHRAAVSVPLEAGVLVGTWLAKEGLVDSDGRLTPAAEIAMLAATTGDAATVGHGLSAALVAYAAARDRSLDGRRDWLEPFSQLVPVLDLREVRAVLEKRVERRMPRWAWAMVLPLAAVGGGLLILSAAAMLEGVLGA